MQKSIKIYILLFIILFGNCKNVQNTIDNRGIKSSKGMLSVHKTNSYQYPPDSLFIAMNVDDSSYRIYALKSVVAGQEGHLANTYLSLDELKQIDSSMFWEAVSNSPVFAKEIKPYYRNLYRQHLIYVLENEVYLCICYTYCTQPDYKYRLSKDLLTIYNRPDKYDTFSLKDKYFTFLISYNFKKRKNHAVVLSTCYQCEENKKN